MIDKKYLIYGLIHPETKELRYIGFTSQNLVRRLCDHVSMKRLDTERSYKSSWIKSLLKIGLRPEIILIKESTKDTWQKDEIEIIKEYKEKGYRLTNLALGGQGAPGVKMSEAHKEKLRRINLGRPSSRKGKHLSEETKLKISIAHTGRKWTKEQREKFNIYKNTEKFKEIISAPKLTLRRITEEQEKYAREQYFEKKKSLAQLSKELGISQGTLGKIVYGRNGEFEYMDRPSKRLIEPLKAYEIIHKFKEGQTRKNLAKEYKTSYSIVQKIIQEVYFKEKEWKEFLLKNTSVMI